ncbi:response regulator [Flavobacterium salilacus subsp. salilacus]|uniref:response regulator n=1 Tax=Flavobacterium TaxID=237 RepID=UPI00107519B3|nr:MULTISPECIES: response regulator [Flavobacterium]KAF2518512.1 response regulator [Flavobacterium salilacus subsp. salilacus]MBE1615154.1 response regulator [Flavobacterium sp. SaA2.13]
MRTVNSLYVIDDDKIYHFLFKNLLKQNGINVVTKFFCDGAEAIDYIRLNNNDQLPDLILLDVNMPIMDGWQFLEEYSKLSISLSKLSIIYMISSSNSEVDINKAKDFNNIVKDYYLKPICKEDLDKIFIAGI